MYDGLTHGVVVPAYDETDQVRHVTEATPAGVDRLDETRSAIREQTGDRRGWSEPRVRSGGTNHPTEVVPTECERMNGGDGSVWGVYGDRAVSGSAGVSHR